MNNAQSYLGTALTFPIFIIILTTYIPGRQLWSLSRRESLELVTARCSEHAHGRPFLMVKVEVQGDMLGFLDLRISQSYQVLNRRKESTSKINASL